MDATSVAPAPTDAEDSPQEEEELMPEKVRAPLRRRLPSGERFLLERAEEKDPRRIDAVAMILDDVLYDHTGQLAHFAIDRGIAQLLEERAFPTNAAAFEALQTFRDAYGYRKRFPRFVDHLVAQHRLTHDQAGRVIAAYYASKIPEARTIKPFAKARQTLLALKESGYRLGLMLVGKRDVQLERLRALNVQELFSDIVFVDANPSVDVLTRAMKKLGRRLMLQPSSILFVGRKAFYEIKAANRAGLVTVRTLFGKYGNVMPTDEMEKPDYHIESIEQLVSIVKLADQQMIKPKIVAIGGGTGLAVLLKELRHYPADLTAVVTVFDSGRHSGELRKYLGILPPGDIRNCLVALSDSDELMNKLMNYRFRENFMEGTSLGNLLLAALTDITGGFDNAVTSLSDILNIHGDVFPATLENTELCAELEDGSVVVSEVNVRSPTTVNPEDGLERKKAAIKRVFLEKPDVEAFLPAVRAIEDADIIVLSPGGFYTSIIATLLVPGIRDAIKRSAGATVYISNVATQCGQTDGYTLGKTLEKLYTYLGAHAIDYVIANNVSPPAHVVEQFFARGEQLLLPDEDLTESTHPVLLQGKTFQDVPPTDGKREWNKAHMIKHSGKMVADILYRVIDRELDTMKARIRRGGHYRQKVALPRELSPLKSSTHASISRENESAPIPRTSKAGAPGLVAVALVVALALTSVLRGLKKTSS